MEAGTVQEPVRAVRIVIQLGLGRQENDLKQGGSKVAFGLLLEGAAVRFAGLRIKRVESPRLT